MYDELLANLAILVLSGFVGFAVISKVPDTLHTPLMSGTNAIHGIVVLGALVVFGEVEHPSLAVQIILFVAVVFGTLNVIGGFIVTDRMLGMFKGKKRPRPSKSRTWQRNELSGYRPLHHLVRALHLRPDGPDRAQGPRSGATSSPRSAWPRGGGDAHQDPPHRVLGADHRRPDRGCGAWVFRRRG